MDISLNSLARRGIFVSFGNASGAVPAFPVLRLIGKSAFVTRPKLLDYTATRDEMLYRSGEIFVRGWRGGAGRGGRGSMMTYKTVGTHTIMRVAGSATSAMRKPQIVKRVRNDEA
jgi:hypothetical protein